MKKILKWLLYPINKTGYGFIARVVLALPLNPDELKELEKEKFAGAKYGSFIHQAVSYKDLGLLKKLLSLEWPQLHYLTRRGQTPLHIAASNNFSEAIPLLLEHGVDPSIKNTHGYTALEQAEYYGKTEAIELLKKVQ